MGTVDSTYKKGSGTGGELLISGFLLKNNGHQCLVGSLKSRAFCKVSSTASASLSWGNRILQLIQDSFDRDLDQFKKTLIDESGISPY